MKKTWIDYVTLSAVVLNLLLTFIGGWFLLFKYEAMFYKAGTDLAETQNKIQLLELSVAKERQKLEVEKSNIAYVGSVIKIINDIKPKGLISSRNENGVYFKEGKMALSFEILNDGIYDLEVKLGLFIVTNKRYSPEEKIPDDAIIYKEQSLDKTFMIAAKSKQVKSFKFDLTNHEIDNLFYLLRYDVRTDQNIVDIMKNAFNKPEETNLNKYSSISMYYSGYLNR